MPNTTPDPGLAVIDAFERAMIQAHDEKVQYGAPAAEIEAQRSAVAAQAKKICDQLRAEHAARKKHHA